MLITSKTIFSKPKFLEKPYGWVQHIPFAFYLVETLRPEVVTELGTHMGNSYFSFCQAADELKLKTKCYAVDTWEGDEHSGFYGKEVYDRVKKINTQHFAHFSYLLKMKFDDALSYFSDGSIDLLHIDGLHTYEAVKHDFESWQPKMSKKGIVVLHDTNVKDREFGVWNLFEEVRDIYPSFEFLHSHGLGIICVGKEVDGDFLDFVEKAKKDTYVNHYFATLGQRIFVMQEKQDVQQELQQIKKSLRQSTKESDSYKEKVADLQQSVKIQQGEIQSLSAKINEQANLSAEKIKAIAKLAEYKTLVNDQEDQLIKYREKLEKAKQNLDDLQEKMLTKEFEATGLRQLLISERDRVKSLDKRNEDLQKSNTNLEEISLALRETGNELRLMLREREEQFNRIKDQNDRLSTFLAEIKKEADGYKRNIEHQNKKLEELKKNLRERDQELSHAKKTAAEYKQQETRQLEKLELHKKDLENKNHNIGQLREHLASAKALIEQRDKKYARVVDDLQQVKTNNKKLKQQLKAKETILQAIVGSISWRITRPVRYFGSLKRKTRAKTLFLLRVLLFTFTFRFKKLRREFRYARYRKVINRSGIFNRKWYLDTYPDVREAGADPVNHYVRHGVSEGRDPSPDFSTKAYLNYNQDVTDSGINPLVHYVLFGKTEGRLAFKSTMQHDNPEKTANENNNVIKAKAESNKHASSGTYPYQISEAELLERVRAYNKQKNSRKAKVVVYTAIIDNYDSLILPETIVDEWDYVLFSDNKIIGEHIFEQRMLTHYHEDPTRIARYVKTHPHEFFGEYEYAIWVDSNILIRGNHLYNQVRDAQAKKILVMANPHPDRHTIDEELEKCILIKKDDPVIMTKQVEHYKSEGYKSDNGLFETGISIRRHNNEKVIHLNEIWWQEIQNGSRRDQLSFPYALWKAGITPEVFPNMKNLRIHDNNDYCLFNHLRNKRNKKVPLYSTPSFLNKKAEEKPAEPSDVVRFKFLIKRLRSNLLEAGFVERAYSDLYTIFKNGIDKTIRSLAAWELAVWHANRKTLEDAQKAIKYLEHLEADTLVAKELEKQLNIIKSECYLLMDQRRLAKDIIINAAEGREDADLLLAASNCESHLTSKLQIINRMFVQSGFSPLSIKTTKPDNLLLNFFSNGKKLNLSNNYPYHPKVSIIIPAYNASPSIEAVLSSISAQTYSHLEIIVVDDNSTDNTVYLVEKHVKKDSRIRLLKLKENMGPYFARNVGLKSAMGDLVTCNDADDWSHPQKIEAQVLCFIRNRTLVASISQWVRVSEKMVFERRNNPGFFIQLNISSLMFKRKAILDTIGYWDTVRFGADTEFYKRILNVFGITSVKTLPAIPLSFAHYSKNTLTGNEIYGYPGYPVGARKEYRDSYEYYHVNTNKPLYAFPPKNRPFPVPDLMNPFKNIEAAYEQKFETVIVSDFRIQDQNLIKFLTHLMATKPKEKIGLFHYEIYDLEINNIIDPCIREIIDGNHAKFLVYGESILCNELIVWHVQSLFYKKSHTPTIRPLKVKVLIQDLSLSDDIKTIINLLNECAQNAKLSFGKNADFLPINKNIRELLLKDESINNVFKFDSKNWISMNPGLHWEPVSLSLKPIHVKYLIKKENKTAVNNNHNIILIDVKTLDKSKDYCSADIIVVMPCIDEQLGLETARFLLSRAAIDCKIAVVYDSQRLGFIHVVNKAVESFNSKYVVYLAQDAFPGRDWLKLAYESLEVSGKGLLGFNDGKWKGRIASFGMINISWAKKLYNGNVFCPEYTSHKADNELTVIARAQNMYVFDPNIVLIEADKNKDERGSNEKDDSVFNERFLTGFNGLISDADIKKYAKEYKIKFPKAH